MSRRVVAGLGLICIVVVLILIALAVQSRPTPAPTPTPTGTATPPLKLEQQGMLIAVREDSGKIADAVMIAASLDASSPRASMISLQPGLGLEWIDTEVDTGVATLADYGPQPPQTTQQRLSGQLGVRIPNGLVLDRLAFAAMVDAVGGVVVEVPEPIYRKTASGKRVLLFPAGRNQLYGPAAAAYVLYLGPEENQLDRMARFDSVWSRIIAGLPPDEIRVRNILGSLGSLARNSTTVSVMSTILLDYQRAQLANVLLAGTLPARMTGSGTGEIYTPDPVATVALSAKLFPTILTATGIKSEASRPTVRLADAGASNTQLTRATERLSAAGFEVVWGGTAAPLTASVVYVSAQQTAVPTATATVMPTIEMWQEIEMAVGIPIIEPRISETAAAGVDAALSAAADLFAATESPTPSSSSSSSSSSSAAGL